MLRKVYLHDNEQIILLCIKSMKGLIGLYHSTVCLNEECKLRKTLQPVLWKLNDIYPESQRKTEWTQLTAKYFYQFLNGKGDVSGAEIFLGLHHPHKMSALVIRINRKRNGYPAFPLETIHRLENKDIRAKR